MRPVFRSGIAISPDDILDAETLLKEADRAMSRAKSQHGIGYHCGGVGNNPGQSA